MTKIELTASEIGTVRLALMGWAERCKAEARTMDAFAVSEKLIQPKYAEKAQRNALASREFADAAEQLLAKLRP